MKYLKLFEGFIDDIKSELLNSVMVNKKPIDNCLQELMDDYNLEFRGDLEYLMKDLESGHIVYTIVDEFQITHDFLDKMKRAFRKINGINISVSGNMLIVDDSNGIDLYVSIDGGDIEEAIQHKLKMRKFGKIPHDGAKIDPAEPNISYDGIVIKNLEIVIYQ